MTFSLVKIAPSNVQKYTPSAVSTLYGMASSVGVYDCALVFVGKLCKHVKTGHVQTMRGSVNLFDDDDDSE